jgi:hypothetical protein
VPPQDQDILDDVVLADGQALSPEIARLRAEAGTLGEVTGEGELLRKGAEKAAEERLGVTGQIQAGIEGAASGLTFGGTRLLNAGDPIAAAQELERQRVFAGTALAGEIGGALLGAGFSGGTGLGGTVARLTPAGLTAARSAQFIARGGTGLSRFGRAVIAGGTEGAIQAAGNYVGQSVLRDDPLTAEGVALSAIKGGAIGAAAGGIVQGASSLFASALRPAGSATDDMARKLAGIDAPEGAPLRINEVMSGKADDVADAHSTLLSKIDEVRARNLGGEVDDLLASPILRNTAASADGSLLKKIERTVRTQADELDRARTAAAEWAKRYQSVIDDVGQTSKSDLSDRMLKAVGDLDDEGAIHLARLDEAVQGYESAIGKVRERFIQAPAATPPLAGVADAVSLPVPAAAPLSTIARLRQAGETVAGGLEAAQDIGLPVPTLSQLAGGGVIGEMLGLYVKARAGARALKATGILPRTATTEAAAQVTGLRQRIQSALTARAPAAAATAGVVAQRIAPKIIAKTAQAITDTANAEDSAMRAASAVDFDAGLSARASEKASAAVQYLAAKAPKNPFVGTAFADAWVLSPLEAGDFQRQVTTVLDPARAVEIIMRDPTAALEADALMAVYPDIASEVRRYLTDNAPDLVAKMPEVQRQFLGQTFDVPLTLSQIPGYTFSMPAAALVPQQVRTARPSNASASPLAKVESLNA